MACQTRCGSSGSGKRSKTGRDSGRDSLTRGRRRRRSWASRRNGERFKAGCIINVHCINSVLVYIGGSTSFGGHAIDSSGQPSDATMHLCKIFRKRSITPITHIHKLWAICLSRDEAHIIMAPTQPKCDETKWYPYINTRKKVPTS